MADERSANPCCLICRLKNCKTSYSGNPSRPGKYQFLLFLSKNGRGVTDNIVRCILVKKSKNERDIDDLENYCVLFCLLNIKLSKAF